MKALPAPLVLGMPLDAGAADVIDAALALTTRLSAPVLPVHALKIATSVVSDVRRIADARATIATWLEPLAQKGVTVLDTVVEKGRPERVVPHVAACAGAQLTIVGSGRGSTARDWLLGTTAERVVRASATPVWIARGTLPGAKFPVVVPIDLGEETRLAILAGARWAKLFGATLRIVHVLPASQPLSTSPSAQVVEELSRSARERVLEILERVEVSVPVDVHIAHGSVGAALLGQAEEAGLVAMMQTDYEMLVPASLDSHVERLMRMSRASVIAVRDDDAELERARREERAAWVAKLRKEGEQALLDGDPARAERLLASAKVCAPTSPRLEDLLAQAIENQGRAAEAERHRALARWLRAELA